MEAINVLQNKAKGTVLFDSVLGENVLFERLEGNRIICSNNDKEQTYKGNGKLFNNADAIVVLTPSRNMQDWSKFAWKKGDVLKHKKAFVMFLGWAEDDYSEFKAKYTFLNDCSINQIENYYTNEFCKASEEETKAIINNIEECYDGKLNLSTLEIEQPKQEFKNGDIVVLDKATKENLSKIVAIYKTATFDGFNSYTYLNVSRQEIVFGYQALYFGRVLRPATEEEKQQLFDALAKNGKRWNPDTKTIEDLPKKCELKPFDKVLVRNNDVETWIPALFGFYDKEFENYVCMGDVFEHCIPYNEETAHLLGTTDEWKGANNG